MSRSRSPRPIRFGELVAMFVKYEMNLNVMVSLSKRSSIYLVVPCPAIYSTTGVTVKAGPTPLPVYVRSAVESKPLKLILPPLSVSIA